MSCSFKKILNIKIRHRAIFIQDFEDQKIAQTVRLHRFFKIQFKKKYFFLLKTFLLTKNKDAADTKHNCSITNIARRSPKIVNQLLLLI